MPMIVRASEVLQKATEKRISQDFRLPVIQSKHRHRADFHQAALANAENQISLTSAASSKWGHLKSNFLSVKFYFVRK